MEGKTGQVFGMSSQIWQSFSRFGEVLKSATSARSAEGRASASTIAIRSQCTECGGASICQNSRQWSRCRDYRGSGICQHNRTRRQCRECGGGSICQHNRIRHHCRQCGGSSICQHNRIRYFCKDCRGAGICQHWRLPRHTCLLAIQSHIMDPHACVEEEPAPCPRARPVTSALARNDAAGLGIASSVWLLLLLSVKQMVLLVESK